MRANPGDWLRHALSGLVRGYRFFLKPWLGNACRFEPSCSQYALDALQRDYAFLLKGDVFTEELLRTYVDYKRSKEVDAIRLRPHPYEFALYYDI